MSWIIWLVALLVFWADFFVKVYFKTYLAGQSIPVIPKILYFTVVFNKGAAFGILRGQTNFLIFIGLIFILFLVIFVIRERKHKMVGLIAYGMILGGAISNFYDRIFLGYVIDYIDFKVWPVFNLSDSCITVGAGILIFIHYFHPRHRKAADDK